MIGEKIKMGFDGTAVKRGIGGIMGGFGKLKRGIGGATRQVGIGMARGAGMSLFGAVTRMVTAIPNQIKDISNLRQEFFALGDATGATVEDMLGLRQAISKTSNVSADMAGKSLKEMVKKIGEAQDYESQGRKALDSMGIGRQEIRGLDPISQMRILADGYQRLRKSAGIEIANDTITDLMGSRMGKDLTPLLLNFESALARGKAETKQTAKYIKGMSKDLDRFDDIGRAFDILAMNSAMGFLGVLKKAGINMGEIATMVEGLDFTKQFKGIGDFIKREYDEFNAYLDKGDLGGYLMSKLAKIGQWIAEMISKGINAGVTLAMENPQIKEILSTLGMVSKGKQKVTSAVDAAFDWATGRKTSSAAYNKLPASERKSTSNAKLEDNTNKTNEILLRMADKGVMAFWGA